MTDIISNLSLDDVDPGARKASSSEMEGIKPTGPMRRANINSTGVMEQAIPICALGATQQPLVDSQAKMLIRSWPADRNGGREMVINLREELGLRPAANASTQFLGEGRGWVTVLPYGVCRGKDWERIVDAAHKG